MDNIDLETSDESVERAVELLDCLLAAADGGDSVTCGQYEASTIIALLADRSYRVEVMSKLDDFAEAETGY